MTYSSRLRRTLELRSVPGFGQKRPPGWVFDVIAERKLDGSDKASKPYTTKKNPFCTECGTQLPLTKICDNGCTQMKETVEEPKKEKDYWL